jgi:flagellar protein FlbD
VQQGWSKEMIVVTRLNGPPLALNCDLIERVEATPDTVLTLVDGTKYVVQEPVEEVVDRIREFRASVLVLAQRLDQTTENEPTLHVLHGDAEPEA